jgi:hypothetical protein
LLYDNHDVQIFQALVERIKPASSSWRPICWLAVPCGIWICTVFPGVELDWASARGGAISLLHQDQPKKATIPKSIGGIASKYNHLNVGFTAFIYGE